MLYAITYASYAIITPFLKSHVLCKLNNFVASRNADFIHFVQPNCILQKLHIFCFLLLHDTGIQIHCHLK